MVKKFFFYLLQTCMIVTGFGALTSCSSDNGDDDSSPSVLDAMSIAPSVFGWSGATVDGIAYYRPSFSYAASKKRSPLKAFREAYDDGEEGPDVIPFMSVRLVGGKCTEARVNMSFPNEEMANYVYEGFKSGSFFDGEAMTGDARLVKTWLQNNTHRDANVVWYPMLGNVGITLSQLKVCVDFWLTFTEDEEDWVYNSAYFQNKGIYEPVFGKWDSPETLNYTCRKLENDQVLVIFGNSTMNIAPIHSSGHSFAGVQITMKFDTEEHAQMWIHSMGDDDELAYEENAYEFVQNGNVVTYVEKTFMAEDFSYERVKNYIIGADIIYNIPFSVFFLSVF